MKKCIGIISYLPNEENTRKARAERINQVISKCDELFNLPIIIVAQNWKEADDIKTSSNCIVYHYEKLGIPVARNTLRDLFLKSNYEYLIMLDDDCLIHGNDATEYINEIEEHPDGFGFLYLKQLKLCAISKYVYSQVEMPNIDAEKNEGTEDTIFFTVLKYQFRDKMFMFKTKDIWLDLDETFTDSTWRGPKIKPLELMLNTKKILLELSRTNWLLNDEE